MSKTESEKVETQIKYSAMGCGHPKWEPGCLLIPAPLQTFAEKGVAQEGI